MVLGGLGGDDDAFIATEGQAVLRPVARAGVELPLADIGAIAQQRHRPHRPDAGKRRHLRHEVGGLLQRRCGARHQADVDRLLAQRQRRLLPARGHVDALGHGKRRGKAAFADGNVKARFGRALGLRGLQRRSAGRVRAGCGRRHGEWRRPLHIQRPGAWQAPAGGGQRLAGGERELHAAPVLARVLRHQRQAFNVHAGALAVQAGAVAGRPARAAHLVGQLQIGIGLRRQRDVHHRHLAGLRIAGLGLQAFERALFLLHRAQRQVQLLLRLARVPAQGLHHRAHLGGSRCRGAGSGCVARLGFQIGLRQLQRIRIRACLRQRIFGSAQAILLSALAAFGKLAIQHLHVDVANAHGAGAGHLQAARVELLRQAGEGGAAAAGGHAQVALHRGAAGVERDAADARAVG